MAFRLHGARRWYIDITTNTRWPGMLPVRGRRSGARGQGYGTEDEARKRAMFVNAHYNAHFGQGLPLAVKYAAPIQ